MAPVVHFQCAHCQRRISPEGARWLTLDMLRARHDDAELRRQEARRRSYEPQEISYWEGYERAWRDLLELVQESNEAEGEIAI